MALYYVDTYQTDVLKWCLSRYPWVILLRKLTSTDSVESLYNLSAANKHNLRISKVSVTLYSLPDLANHRGANSIDTYSRSNQTTHSLSHGPLRSQENKGSQLTSRKNLFLRSCQSDNWSRNSALLWNRKPSQNEPSPTLLHPASVTAILILVSLNRPTSSKWPPSFRCSYNVRKRRQTFMLKASFETAVSMCMPRRQMPVFVFRGNYRHKNVSLLNELRSVRVGVPASGTRKH